MIILLYTTSHQKTALLDLPYYITLIRSANLKLSEVCRLRGSATLQRHRFAFLLPSSGIVTSAQSRKSGRESALLKALPLLNPYN